MNKIQLGAAAFIAAIAFPAHAVMTAESQREIEHLIDYVGNSGCDFYRNGTWYSGDRGRSHLRDKYDYAKNHGLSTAEQFVEKVASTSSLSGRPYKVRCNGNEVIASAFLNEELQRYRSNIASGTSGATSAGSAKSTGSPPAAASANNLTAAPVAALPAEVLNCSIPMSEPIPSSLTGLAKISKARAQRAALADVKGTSNKVASSELEVEQSCLVYTFDIKVADSKGVEEILVDAGNGKILSHKHETEAQEARERRASK